MPTASPGIPFDPSDIEIPATWPRLDLSRIAPPQPLVMPHFSMPNFTAPNFARMAGFGFAPIIVSITPPLLDWLDGEVRSVSVCGACRRATFDAEHRSTIDELYDRLVSSHWHRAERVSGIADALLDLAAHCPDCCCDADVACRDEPLFTRTEAECWAEGLLRRFRRRQSALRDRRLMLEDLTVPALQLWPLTIEKRTEHTARFTLADRPIRTHARNAAEGLPAADHAIAPRFFGSKGWSAKNGATKEQQT